MEHIHNDGEWHVTIERPPISGRTEIGFLKKRRGTAPPHEVLIEEAPPPGETMKGL
jgi:hypothetical protein